MYKRIGIIVTLFLFLLNVSAQKRLNFVEVDSTSYQLFQQQKWRELIAYSAQSRKQGIDFFYLQARTGIAFFNLGKYRTAFEWFLKAYKSDQQFEWLQEYVYYSLVYSGRKAEAMKLANDFSPDMKSKIGFKRSKILRVALEGGYSFNPDFDQLVALDLGKKVNVNDDYGEAFIPEYYHFESFDLSHQIVPGFSLNHNLTYLQSTLEQTIDWGTKTTFPAKTNQFQYFINPHFVLGQKIHLSPALSVLWGNTTYLAGWLDNNSNRNFTEVDDNFSDFIFSTSAWSHFGNLSPGAEVNFANIYDETFTQLSAWVTFYPLSNADFYITPRAYFKSDSEISFSYNTFGISSGVQLGKVHLNGQYLVGDMKNFIEAAGYVVSNIPGKSDHKFTGSIYIPISKNGQLIFRYINQNMEEKYRIYVAGVESNSINYNFTKHTLTAGISWSF